MRKSANFPTPQAAVSQAEWDMNHILSGLNLEVIVVQNFVDLYAHRHWLRRTWRN